MKKFTIITALLLMVIGTTFAQKGTFNKITSDLREEMNQSRDAQAMFRVIIIMNEQLDAQKSARQMQYLGKEQQRDLVVNELQLISQRSQKDVLKDLQQGQRAALVDDVRTFWIINAVGCSMTRDMVEAVSERPDVKYVMKDLETHLSDAEESEKVIIDVDKDGTTNAWNVTKVNADQVWELGYTGAGVIVAVIDSGVNYNHTDIANNMWDGGTAYPHHGWDFVNNDNDPMDDRGHGSHCAGTVSSSGTNGKQCGIAKDAKIMALKVLDASGNGNFSDTWAAIEFAVSHGANVLSLSLGAPGVGGYWPARVIMENVLHCGIVASVAAGNVGDKFDSNGDLKYPIPFNVDLPGNCPSPWRNPAQTLNGGRSAVVTVGATTKTTPDEHSDFSSYGPVTWSDIEYYNDYPWRENDIIRIGLIKPDVSAPGTGITSLSHVGNSGYAIMNGTSMATPCVAGVMALMLSVNPTLSPVEIDSIIETTAVYCKNQTSKDNTFGAGRIDALAAVNYMLNACDAPTNLTSIVNRANVNLSWDAANGVSTYRVYRDGAMIANNVSGNSYSDVDAPAGTHVYYVRSNGSNYQASIPSNRVTVSVATNVEANTPSDLTVTNINTSDNTVTLGWTAPDNLVKSLYYTDIINDYYVDASTVIAAQKFTSSMLQAYAGMQIDHVCFKGQTSGTEYTISLYEGDALLPGNLLYQDNYITTEDEENVNYTLIHPVILNPNNDLWLTLSFIGGIGCHTNHEGDGTNNCRFYRYASDKYWLSYPDAVAWAFQIGLSNGEYTYNVYLNDSEVSSSQSATSYTSPCTEGLNRYQVTAKSNGYESKISNSITLVSNRYTAESDLSIEPNDKLYILPNSTLTVNGTLSNTDPDRLIIEDGGLLIHNSQNVQATVKKDITGHGENDLRGWGFITSPISSSITTSGLITDNLGSNATTTTATYDLYYYDEDDNYWRNYRTTPFDLNNGQGYLYANNTGTTISFIGTINSNDSHPTIEATASSNHLKGFNLVGNPFTRNLSISSLALETNKVYEPITAIYELNNGCVVVNQNPSPIAPCTGFFIQTDDAGTLHFNHDWPNQNNGNNNGDLRIELNTASREAKLLDRAYINFHNDNKLEKFTLNPDATKLYIPLNGKDYAIVNAENQDEIPVNFRAAENGSYTLTINPEDVKLGYLHLIDNITGNDIDLLSTPDYTFEAKTTDYASRFKLVFSPEAGASSNSATFAFMNDGNIIITNANNNATLQIVDMMGRVIVQGDAINRISTSGMSPGMYVLRLINGENIRTQKIVIE